MLQVDMTMRGLFGALRLAGGNSDGIAVMDMSPAGLRGSLLAPVLAFPFWLAGFALYYSPGSTGLDALTWFVLAATTFTLSWAGFLLLMKMVLPMLDLQEDAWERWACSWNWSQALFEALALPLLILLSSGWLSDSFSMALSIALLLAMLAYAGFVTRVALQAPFVVVSIVIGLNILFALMVQGFAASIILGQKVQLSG